MTLAGRRNALWLPWGVISMIGGDQRFFFFRGVFLKLTFVVEGSEDDIIWGIDFWDFFLHALNEEQIWCFSKLGEPRNTRFSSRIHRDCGWSPHFFSTNPKSSGFSNYILQVEGSLFFCNPISLWFRTYWSPNKLLKATRNKSSQVFLCSNLKGMKAHIQTRMVGTYQL